MNKPFELDDFPKVKIVADGTTAQVFINGQKVPRVLGYKVEQNAQEKRMAEVTLRVQCDLCLETTSIPALPEPWATLVKGKDGEVDVERVKLACSLTSFEHNDSV